MNLLQLPAPYVQWSLAMNDKEFREHIKDMMHGKHHPEEHDWDEKASAPRKKRASTPKRGKKRG